MGRTKTIACYISTAETVNGFPIAWSRGGKRLTASDEQTVKVSGTVTYTAFYKLTVAVSDNLAVFTCTATLPSGTTSATTTVYVLSESPSVSAVKDESSPTHSNQSLLFTGLNKLCYVLKN